MHERKSIIRPIIRTPDKPVPTEVDLENDGFNSAEIQKLKGLQEIGAYIEFTDSEKQMEHLRFTKWRYENGDLQHTEGTVENEFILFQRQKRSVNSIVCPPLVETEE